MVRIFHKFFFFLVLVILTSNLYAAKWPIFVSEKTAKKQIVIDIFKPQGRNTITSGGYKYHINLSALKIKKEEGASFLFVPIDDRPRDNNQEYEVYYNEDLKGRVTITRSK